MTHVLTLSQVIVTWPTCVIFWYGQHASLEESKHPHIFKPWNAWVQKLKEKELFFNLFCTLIIKSIILHARTGFYANSLFYVDFLSPTLTFHSTEPEGGVGPFITLLCHLHPLHKHFNISLVITAKNSLLDIASERTRTKNPLFPSISR